MSRPRRIRVLNESRSTELGDRIAVADTRWLRLRGLLGRPEPGQGEGLLIDPSRAVHMYGMRYPLDILFVATDGRVEATYEGLEPGSRSGRHPDARYALELPTGTIDDTGTRIGDRLTWTQAS